MHKLSLPDDAIAPPPPTTVIQHLEGILTRTNPNKNVGELTHHDGRIYTYIWMVLAPSVHLRSLELRGG